MLPLLREKEALCRNLQVSDIFVRIITLNFGALGSVRLWGKPTLTSSHKGCSVQAPQTGCCCGEIPGGCPFGTPSKSMPGAGSSIALPTLCLPSHKFTLVHLKVLPTVVLLIANAQPVAFSERPCSSSDAIRHKLHYKVNCSQFFWEKRI